MSLLKKSSQPPMWLSESISLAFLAVAFGAAIAATDRWTGGNLVEMAGQIEKVNLRTLIPACAYSIVALASLAIGIWTLFGSRYIKQRDADIAGLVHSEMEENFGAQMAELVLL
jgi:hypothetical protein